MGSRSGRQAVASVQQTEKAAEELMPGGQLHPMAKPYKL